MNTGVIEVAKERDAKVQEMRFFQNAPAIPSRLLQRADAGEVVFFCGAGVSRARAKLDDFSSLVRNVTKKLGVFPSSPVAKIWELEQQLRAPNTPIDLPPEVPSVISADRLFGLLEQEFPPNLVEREVAMALRTPDNVDLSAHKTLIKLAKAKNGVVRLVTTNFDHLFELASGNSLEVLTGPDLPDAWNGIVKLHGSANETFDGSTDDGFVLSTAGFGHAYMASGWASRFMAAVLKRFTVVFVGYAADDPPMQYLLEALARMGPGQVDAYTFQGSGTLADRWKSRGVKPMIYSDDDDHSALWRTLEMWADRVSDPASWRQQTATMAHARPSALKPHERGQVADLVSTTAGAEALTETEAGQPPAEWLCVFDRQCRFADRGSVAPRSISSEEFDPYDLFCLDDDAEPATKKSSRGERAIPDQAWSAFDWSELDRRELSQQLGARNGIVPRIELLPPRIVALLNWLSKVAREPAAVWWVTRQPAIHPTFNRLLTHQLRSVSPQGPCDANQAWAYLIDAKENQKQNSASDYDFEQDVKQSGWTERLLHRYQGVTRPRLLVEPDHHTIPPAKGAGVSRRRLFRRDVDFRESYWAVEVPDRYLATAVAILRQHLETIRLLRAEMGSAVFFTIPPIVVSDDRFASAYEYEHGLGGAFFAFLRKLERLHEIAPDRFEDETRCWPKSGGVFGRLSIWLAQNGDRSTAGVAFELLNELDEDDFWNSRHTRDLLHAIRDRWSEFTAAQRKCLQERLYQGPRQRWYGEKSDEFDNRCAWVALSALFWLHANGAQLKPDWSILSVDLRARAPEWTEDSGHQAADSTGARGGRVETNTDASALDGAPDKSVVRLAAETSGRRYDFMINEAPFMGLSIREPKRALHAIAGADAEPEQIAEALSVFLRHDVRKHHSNEVVKAASSLLPRLDHAVFAGAIVAISDWLAALTKGDPAQLGWDSAEPILDRSIGVLKTDPVAFNPQRDTEQIDWVFEAINSPAGHLTDAIYQDPAMPKTSDGKGLGSSWRSRAEALLELPQKQGLLVLARLAQNLPYLFAQDDDWTKAKLLPRLSDPDGRAIVLQSFLQGSHHPPPEFFNLLKQQLMGEIARRGSETEDTFRFQNLAAVMLSAWLSPDCDFADEELRRTLYEGPEAYREAILWHCERSLTNGAEDYDEQISQLVERVWPKQTVARGNAVTMAFLKLLAAAGDRFPELKRAVSLFLDRPAALSSLYFFRSGKNEHTIEQFPADFLDLLHSILPLDVAYWPYDLGKVLEKIVTAEPALKDDPRFTSISERAVR